MMQRKCNFKNYNNNSNNQCPIWLVIKKKGGEKTVFKITQAITLGNGKFPRVWYYYFTGFFDKQCPQ